MISFETDSELTHIKSNALSHSFLKSITIPRHLQILCSKCILNCQSLSLISFGIDSELISIKSNEFPRLSITSIKIHRDIQFTHDSAFSNISNMSNILNIAISIESHNSHFAVISDFILDSSNPKLIHHFCNPSRIIYITYIYDSLSSSISLFNVFLQLSITFIDFIPNKFRIDTHRINAL